MRTAAGAQASFFCGLAVQHVGRIGKKSWIAAGMQKDHGPIGIEFSSSYILKERGHGLTRIDGIEQDAFRACNGAQCFEPGRTRDAVSLSDK